MSGITKPIKSAHELTQLFIQERIDTLRKQLKPDNWEITNKIIKARISELEMIQVIAGKPEGM